MVGCICKTKVAPTLAARRAREGRHKGRGKELGAHLLFKDRPPVTHFLQSEPSTFYRSHQFPQIPLVGNEVTFSHLAFGGLFRSKP